MAPGWAGMTTPVIATTLAPWFVRRRGLAISLALNGASCGGVFVALALVALVGRYGFATAVRAGVVAMVCVLVPVAIVGLGVCRVRVSGAVGEVGVRVAGATTGRGRGWGGRAGGRCGMWVLDDRGAVRAGVAGAGGVSDAPDRVLAAESGGGGRGAGGGDHDGDGYSGGWGWVSSSRLVAAAGGDGGARRSARRRRCW